MSFKALPSMLFDVRGKKSLRNKPCHNLIVVKHPEVFNVRIECSDILRASRRYREIPFNYLRIVFRAKSKHCTEGKVMWNSRVGGFGLSEVSVTKKDELSRYVSKATQLTIEAVF